MRTYSRERMPRWRSSTDRAESSIVVVTHGYFLRTIVARVLLGPALSGEAFQHFQRVAAIRKYRADGPAVSGRLGRRSVLAPVDLQRSRAPRGRVDGS